ncbi:MAG: glycoside hydrolase family 32 protein [Anaerolineales bacterium]|nr:glycoside hydrolase family 32 protein [Anaerolineales bacterium]
MTLNEPYRPHFHVSPPENWVNDPNGLVYYDGEYHLFFQQNPNDTIWGPMHWGHAVSRDLVNWVHFPTALYPDEIGTIFSGSAVIDWHNTGGYGEEAMVAIFTHDTGKNRQMQSIAYSTDNGRTWTKYEGNPVLEPPNNIRNFRDPKVFWYESEEDDGHWVMSVTGGNIILFFTSPDLKNWESSGGFGLTHGATCGVWETPDLFELPVDNGPETRWVLAVAIGGCAPAGGSGIQYFVGDFDGRTFTNDNNKDLVLWADFGADFYAPQSWSDAPDGRKTWIAWMNNWTYAQDIPTSPWRGAFTLPRDLTLKTTSEGIRLVQTPITELATLRGEHWSWKEEGVTAVSPQLTKISGELFEIIAEFPVSLNMETDRFGLRLRTGDDEQTTIGYATKEQKLFIDRTQSGPNDFSNTFGGVHVAPLPPIDGVIRLHIFVDRSSVELFANDGLLSVTDQIFPSGNTMQIELFADGGDPIINQLDIYQLHNAAFSVTQEGN